MALMLLVFLVAYIPLIGVVLLTPLWMTFSAVAYLDLRRLEEQEKTSDPFPISAADLRGSPVAGPAGSPVS